MNYFSKKNILTVAMTGLLAMLLAFTVSFAVTPKYKSTVKLLTVFNQADIDTYTASKTANYITGIIGEVVYSDSFVASVYKSDNSLIDDLGASSEARAKNWKKHIKTQILDNKGIINIDTFSNDRSQSDLLASDIANAIVNNHGAYDGSADRVTIKVIDSPAAYPSWSIMKIFRDAGLGFLAGLMIGITIIVIFPNHRLFETSGKRKRYYYEPAAAFEAAPLAASMNNQESLPRQSSPQPEIVPTETVAEPSAAAVQPTKPSRIEQQLDEDDHNYAATHPWLKQYYAENLPDRENTNN